MLSGSLGFASQQSGQDWMYLILSVSIPGHQKLRRTSSTDLFDRSVQRLGYRVRIPGFSYRSIGHVVMEKVGSVDRTGLFLRPFSKPIAFSPPWYCCLL